MDRIIEIKVFGNHLTKDSKNAGTKGEANITNLRITFDEGWDGYTKEVVFWDAYGENAVRIELTTNRLENIVDSTRVYLIPIPAEAMARAGMLTFTIKGYLDNKKQVSITSQLEVKDAPDILEPVDPTPTELQQMQIQIESIIQDIRDAVEAKEDIENMSVSAETLEPTASAFVKKTKENDVVHLHFGLPEGRKGEPGHTPKKGVDYFTEEDIAGLCVPKYDQSLVLSMYNEVDIIPSPEKWFLFNESTKTIERLNDTYKTEIEGAEELIVPYMIGGVMVENIGTNNGYYSALHYCGENNNRMNIQNIKKVRLPNSIKSIGEYCFNSWRMEDINLPTSCSYIGRFAFADTGYLKQIITPIRPNWELSIGSRAFEFSGLDNIDNLLDGIKEIPDGAFSGNMNLSSITVAESVEYIGEDGLQPQYGEIAVLTILNKNCVLNSPFKQTEGYGHSVPDWRFPKMIKGYSGSTAESYAKKWNIAFVSIEGAEFATKEEVGKIEPSKLSLYMAGIKGDSIDVDNSYAGLIYSMKSTSADNNWVLQNMSKTNTDDGFGKYTVRSHTWGSEENLAKITIPLGDDSIKYDTSKKVVIETVLKGTHNSSKQGRIAIRLNSEDSPVASKDGRQEEYAGNCNHTASLVIGDFGGSRCIGYADGKSNTDNKQTNLQWYYPTSKDFWDGERTFKVVIKLDKPSHSADYEIYEEKDNNWSLLHSLKNADLGYFSTSETLHKIDIIAQSAAPKDISVDYVKVWNMPEEMLDRYEEIEDKWITNIVPSSKAVRDYVSSVENKIKDAIEEVEGLSGIFKKEELVYSEDGSPNSSWVIGNGLTRDASITDYANYLVNQPTASGESVNSASGILIPMPNDGIDFKPDKVIVIETQLRVVAPSSSQRIGLYYNTNSNVYNLNTPNGEEISRRHGYNHTFLGGMAMWANGFYYLRTDGVAPEDENQSRLFWSKTLNDNLLTADNTFNIRIEMDVLAQSYNIKIKRNNVLEYTANNSNMGWLTTSNKLENLRIGCMTEAVTSFGVDYVKVWNREK